MLRFQTKRTDPICYQARLGITVGGSKFNPLPIVKKDLLELKYLRLINTILFHILAQFIRSWVLYVYRIFHSTEDGWKFYRLVKHKQ